MTQKGQINSMLDALNIPQKIDIVDFNRAPEILKENILREGIAWKKWFFDPKNKAIVEELKEALKQKADRSLDLSFFEL